MPTTLLSAPLQGFTDFRFRNAFNKCFGGIDTYFAPYVRLAGKPEIKPSQVRDLLPENNTDINLIPQVMTNKSDEFLLVVSYIKSLGYKEINWNLGCPYPMVVNRKLGAGLLSDPSKIQSILEQVLAKTDIAISIKIRLGNKTPEEIFQVLPLLEKFPIKNITIHPRIARQMYKDEVDLTAFAKCLQMTSHKVIYNGDITSVIYFRNLQEQFPSVDHWMIGRGMIADPFLPVMIKNNSTIYPENKITQFREFHDLLFNDYSHALSGAAHLIMKMISFWEYFGNLFPDARKELKKVKKAKLIETYSAAVDDVLKTWE